MGDNRKSKPDMSRGLSQVLYNYLPDKTFDLTGGKRIAKVTKINGEIVKDLRDLGRIHKEINRYISKWDENNRIGFSDNIELYIYEKPHCVIYDIFPLVFRCPRCKRVYSYSDYKSLQKYNAQLTCLYGSNCQGIELKQVYQVAVHECGALTGLYPLKPKDCKCNDWRNNIILDERKSQKITDFRWVCKKCNNETELKYYCNNCHLDNKEMSIAPHRAGKNYYAHSVKCVDVAESNYLGKWQEDVKRYLGINEAVGINLSEIDDILTKMPENIRNEFLARVNKSEIDINLINKEIANSLHEYLETENPEAMTSYDIWKKANLLQDYDPSLARLLLDQANRFKGLGIENIVLVEDFPVVTALFGFTRGDSSSVTRNGKNTVINSYRLYSDTKGKIPIFTDNGKCEALMFKLEPLSVLDWLGKNGFEINIEKRDSQYAKYWLLKEMESFNRYDQLVENTVTKYVYGLIHSLSHTIMKGVAGISGFELTGLSEYLFPSALSFVIYSNKTDFSIGGLHTLFETQLDLLLERIISTQLRVCLYDPLCMEKEGSCHACMYLPEITCWAFNKNLSRHYLYGGNGVKGYWEGKF